MPLLRNSNAAKPAARRYPEVVTISVRLLEEILRNFLNRFKSKDFWVAPLGIAITILMTLVVSEFKDVFGIPAFAWRQAAILLFIVFSVWTFIALLRAKRGPTLADVLKEVNDRASSKPRRYGLLFFKASDNQGANRFLVYFDATWECYLCPYVRLHDDQEDLGDVSEPASDRLGLPSNALQASALPEHIVHSQKKSEATGKITNYQFEFYFIKIVRPYQTHIAREEFTIQGRQYRWATVAEVLSHAQSMERNGEVFRHIQDNEDELLGWGQTNSLEAMLKG